MDALLQAGSYLGTLAYWQALLAGVSLAIVTGLVPGVGSLLVMAILLPFIVFNIQDPAVALVMLAAIAGTNNTLDSIPAVVVGVPSGATQVTFLEGHQLARRGQAAYCLGGHLQRFSYGWGGGCSGLGHSDSRNQAFHLEHRSKRDRGHSDVRCGHGRYPEPGGYDQGHCSCFPGAFDRDCGCRPVHRYSAVYFWADRALGGGFHWLRWSPGSSPSLNCSISP